ncbi:MAG: hypothetical protein Q8Q07_08620 [Dehalococcoidales bacterium]|nr:hypothetical protein [Dehalococcoidales bacterium]
MSLIKSLALSLLGFLLFLSLSTFGSALVVKNTLLDPDFVTAELESLDIASLSEEFSTLQAPGGETATEMKAALVKTITSLEPLIKERLNTAIYTIYDYLLDESQSLDLALTLKNTVLSTDFIVSLAEELDISSLAGEYLKQQISGNIPPEMAFLTENINQSLDKVITELRPWLKEQIVAAADPLADYLLGESQSFSIVISLEPVKEGVRDKLWAALLESPPPQLTLIPREMWEPLFDQFYQEFAAGIPATFELDQNLIGTETPASIAEALTSAEETLAEAKLYVSYFLLGYTLLIVFMALLVLGIILISRDVKYITRTLGTTLAVYGVFQFAGVLIARQFAGKPLPLGEIPPTLQTWLTQLFYDILSPMLTFSLYVLAGGVVLLIVSFVYNPRQSE